MISENHKPDHGEGAEPQRRFDRGVVQLDRNGGPPLSPTTVGWASPSLTALYLVGRAADRPAFLFVLFRKNAETPPVPSTSHNGESTKSTRHLSFSFEPDVTLLAKRVLMLKIVQKIIFGLSVF